MKFLVDENVSLAVAERLRKLGNEAEAVIESGLSSSTDREIFQRAVKQGAVLITRDHHFTNGILFPATQTKGIIYFRQGNLRSDKEAELIEKIIREWPLEKIEGKLLTIYKKFSTIR